MGKHKTVFVGLSGGVDSSVAALRLTRAGYRVVGVFIKVWHPPFLTCNWEAERVDAMRVAAHLNIPFLTCDAAARYEADVARYFISEYAAGRTPNPDVMCNQHIKFGAFLTFARAHGADAIATGHYARRSEHAGAPALMRGVDTAKDQSYFLWHLTPAQLIHTHFPVGDTPKADIRAEAADAALPTATKHDSQGICFLGHVDVRHFLGRYLDLQRGPVRTLAGETIGEHAGAVCYTPGQRHGLTITDPTPDAPPLYVVRTDPHENIVFVSPEPPHLAPGETISLGQVLLREPLLPGAELLAQTRYRQKPFPVTVIASDADQLTLRTHVHTSAAAPGQSCVLYRGERCVGGGIIA